MADPDQLRDTSRERYEKMVVRLQDELDQMIKIYQFARESLENEMFSGMGYKKMALGEKDVKKLKELTIGLNSLVETKIKYDKAAKSLAENMSLAEEMTAVVTFICSLPYEEQHNLRKRLVERGVWPWKQPNPEIEKPSGN